MSKWERTVLAAPGAPERVAQIEEELQLAAGLTELREKAGLSQRQLAERLGVRQPRVAAIERSRNVTVDVLERYVAALGGQIELSLIHDGQRITLIGGHREVTAAKKTSANRTTRSAGAANAIPAKKPPAKAPHAGRAAVTKGTPAKRAARKTNA